VIDLLGLVIFAVVIGIGLSDVRSGLGPFAMYRSATEAGVRRRTPATGHRGNDNQPNPPAPTR
jgi:hypothetical protein